MDQYFSNISVQKYRRFVIGEAGNRACGIGTNAGQVTKKGGIGRNLAAKTRDYFLRRFFQIPRAAIVPHALPDAQNFFKRRARKMKNRGEHAQKFRILFTHTRYLCLLEHYLGDKNFIRTHAPRFRHSPRQIIALIFAVPIEYIFLKSIVLGIVHAYGVLRGNTGGRIQSNDR